MPECPLKDCRFPTHRHIPLKSPVDIDVPKEITEIAIQKLKRTVGLWKLETEPGSVRLDEEYFVFVGSKQRGWTCGICTHASDRKVSNLPTIDFGYHWSSGLVKWIQKVTGGIKRVRPVLSASNEKMWDRSVDDHPFLFPLFGRTVSSTSSGNWFSPELWLEPERNVDIDRIDEAQGFERVKALDDAVDSVLFNEETKMRFLFLAGRVEKLFKAVLPDEHANEFLRIQTLLEVMVEKIQSFSPVVDISEWVRGRSSKL